MAFTVGGMFAFVQYLSSNGYIQVNYDRLSRDFEVCLYFNSEEANPSVGNALLHVL